MEVTGTTLSVSPLFYKTNVDAKYHVQETQIYLVLTQGLVVAIWMCICCVILLPENPYPKTISHKLFEQGNNCRWVVQPTCDYITVIYGKKTLNMLVDH